MKFNKHYRLEGKHAYLGASSYSWLRYTDEKFDEVYNNKLAIEKGTALHDLASKCIKLGQNLPKTQKTMNMFVNDSIGFRMQSEVLLYYSDNCFGTADALSYRNNLLRISDLKTGKSKASFDQLLIYAAMFCLEYNVNPNDIDIEFRIYQFNELHRLDPDPVIVLETMGKIITFDKRLTALKGE